MTESLARDFYPRRLVAAVAVGAALFVVAGALPLDPDTAVRAQLAAGVTGIVAVCWLAGALPLGAASLLPLGLMPLLGVQSITDTASAYAHPILWLFFGGFVLALGVERWGLHRRIALGIIRHAGIKPTRLIFGFMLASAFLSMWLSNTGTTLLLLPIALALVDSLSKAGGISKKGEANFAFTLLVGIAYAASIGGMATPIGTAPNALFLSNYAPFEDRGAPAMTFLVWMTIAIPVVALMLPGVWYLLTRWLAPVEDIDSNAQSVLDAEAKALPKISAAEVRIAVLFALAAVLWTTRRDVVLGSLTIPGWWRLLPVDNAKSIGDGAISVLIAVIAFVVPSGRRRGEALMNWETAKRIPWDILMLLGGGIAIAQSFTATGLAEAIGFTMKPLVTALPLLLMVLIVCTLMTFLTEVTSNTATTALLLPILISTSVAAGIDPRILTLPATFSASCAFMLPIATPPNAIVFGSGRIPMRRMAKCGIVINLLGVVVITAVMWFVAMPLLGIDPTVLPEWTVAP